MEISRHKIIDYKDYQAEDFEVWKILFERQMKNLPGKADEEFLKGIEKIGFTADKIPAFETINEVLQKLTGWKVYVVPGLIPEKDFFELMQGQNFCASTWLRSKVELDYLEEPDMFHDIFGHVPLLTNEPYCKFLEELCRIAHKHIDNALVVEAVSRIYWYTIEFGLIREHGQLRIYGAGILSSKGESSYCLGLEEEKPEYIDYDVETLIGTAYIKHKYQETYFVIDSYEQLYSSIPEIEEYAERMYQKSLEAQRFYESFSDDEHQIWKDIYNNHIEKVKDKVASDYWVGLKVLGFNADCIPNFDDVNQVLLKNTYWRINSLDNPETLESYYNFKKNRNFFPFIMSSKNSPNELTKLSTEQSFEYLLSAVPLLIKSSKTEGVAFEANKYYCQFLEELFGLIHKNLGNKKAMLHLARLYWYTVQFGLIKEQGQIKMFGVGIMSSPASEIERIFGEKNINYVDYDIKRMMTTVFYNENQETYFVVNSYKELYDSIPDIKLQLHELLESAVA